MAARRSRWRGTTATSNPPVPPGSCKADQRRFGHNDEGIMYVGDKGVILAGFNGDQPRVYPESSKYTAPPAQRGEVGEGGPAIDQWLAAIKGGPASLTNFEVQSPVTEAFLLGCLAQRFPGRTLRMGLGGGTRDQLGKSDEVSGHTCPERLSRMTLDRICISTWSFHTLFEKGRMQVLDFPELIADRYGVHHLEIVAPHFGDADPGRRAGAVDTRAFPDREYSGRHQGALGDAQPVVSRRCGERARGIAVLRVDRACAGTRCPFGAMRSRPASI